MEQIKGSLVFALTLLSALLSLAIITPSLAVKPEQKKDPAYQSWNLTEKGRITMIYDNDSIYAALLEKAAKQYNAVEPVFLFTDSIDKADIIIFDYKKGKKAGTEEYGITYSDGKIGFNTYKLDKADDDTKLSLCLHELGHAIGLAHNKEKDSVMGTRKNVTKLSENDKHRIWTIRHQTKEKNQ